MQFSQPLLDGPARVLFEGSTVLRDVVQRVSWDSSDALRFLDFVVAFRSRPLVQPARFRRDEGASRERLLQCEQWHWVLLGLLEAMHRVLLQTTVANWRSILDHDAFQGLRPRKRLSRINRARQESHGIVCTEQQTMIVGSPCNETRSFREGSPLF